MKILGNILTCGNFSGDSWCNVVENKSNIIETLPTLVIGWDLAKKTYPTASVLDWKINETTFWTFGNRERRHVFEKNVDEFKKMCLEKVISDTKYVFHNVLIATDDENKCFLDKLKSAKSGICSVLNDMAYFSLDNENTVYGLSCRDLEYLGKSKHNFFIWLKAMTNITFVPPINNIPFDIKNKLQNKPYLLAMINT